MRLTRSESRTIINRFGPGLLSAATAAGRNHLGTENVTNASGDFRLSASAGSNSEDAHRVLISPKLCRASLGDADLAPYFRCGALCFPIRTRIAALEYNSRILDVGIAIIVVIELDFRKRSHMSCVVQERLLNKFVSSLGQVYGGCPR